MRHITMLLAGMAALALSGCKTTGGQEVKVSDQLPAEASGEISFKSRTMPQLPYYEYVKGMPAGETTVVEGDLELPDGQAPKAGFPAVIFSHSAGGIEPADEDVWLDMFQAQGFATFQLDHFTPRGVQKTVENPDKVSTASMAADILKAHELLRTHPQINANAIGVMGRSKGGISTILTAKKSWQRGWVESGPLLAFHIGLFPMCHRLETYDIAAPMLIMIGSDDGWVSPSDCRKFAEEASGAGADVRTRVYEGAYHAFDASYDPVQVDDASSWVNCHWRLNDDGSGLDITTNEKLTKSEQWRDAADRCKRDASPYVGRDRDARQMAVRDTKAFLQRIGVMENMTASGIHVLHAAAFD